MICKECSTSKCKACPNDICLQCLSDIYEISYPDLTEEIALENILKEMNLSKHPVYDIFCSNSQKFVINGIKMPLKYYVWNNYKRTMIEIIGNLCHKSISIHSYDSEINNDYFQSVIQEYKFTHQDHIYEKNNKIYRYNNHSLKFEEINSESELGFKLKCGPNKRIVRCDTGTGEKCKSCESKYSRACASCNEGYYLPNDDKTKCKRCTDKNCKICSNDICLLTIDI